MTPDMEDVKCVLLDIEGTVCPISFVKETLFPYALKALPEVVTNKWNDPDFITYRDAFPTEHRTSPEVLQAHVEDLTRRDVKIAYLKNLQGYLWETGYKTGAYTTPLFPDVEPEFSTWKQQGLTLAIYSSGSVFAQKLLFSHVKEAEHKVIDLTPLISGWYDTTNAGMKADSNSYTKIAKELNFSASDILFFSDNVKEVEAALAAGMKSVVVDRPGNAPLSAADKEKFKVVHALHDISLSAARIDSRFWKK
ncbi:hypothetical protein AMS68_007321 [Peltaster fructicola]|uniref:Enolase-phosphatase E1 n=1 Tax=Peltaster fructicola TaxID=286661 RepID=A0A6H0Y464_9PEZI|nr:hypothetical protein AMS68_007321 [Peltaster fructicola]